MADRKASGLTVCPACQFTEAVRLETSILTKFALWQCLDCRLVFIQPHNESQVDRAERRRDLPLRVIDPAWVLAELPERSLAVERRHLLKLANALSRRTLELLNTRVRASVHRAHRQRIAAYRLELRRYVVRWRTAQ
jgi:hypothetical protein